MHYDIIVIGVGSMGSSTCWHLAQRGYNVLGIEQFDIPHDQGSHAGQTRITRKAYFEHPDYVPLLLKAYENWANLEAETGVQVYYPTGLVYFGDKNHPVLKGSYEAAQLYDIPFKNIDKKDAANQFPQFNIPPQYETYFEPEAGFLTPERAVLLYAQEAIKRGATIKTKEKLIEWHKKGDLIEVKTNKNTYFSKKLIITTGAWAGKTIPNLQTPLTVTKQIVAWANPKKWDDFALGKIPCWFIADDDYGMFYGFPVLNAGQFGGPIGFKTALHIPGEIVEPDYVNRIIQNQDAEVMEYCLNKYFPDAFNGFLSLKSCLYTYSKDENFIIDLLPEYDNDVAIACGFSGHGFKFSSVVGEILADLSTEGSTDLPIDFLRLKRNSLV